MLIFQNRADAPTVDPDGFELTPWEPRFGPARSDLDLYLWETPQGLSGYFLYNTALFAPATMDRLARRLLTVLEFFADRSSETLSSMRFDASFSLPRLGMRRTRPAD